jgi:hypothetical protein
VRIGTGFMWLRTGKSRGLLLTWWWICWFCRLQIISQSPEQLSLAQHWVYYTELVKFWRKLGNTYLLDVTKLQNFLCDW